MKKPSRVRSGANPDWRSIILALLGGLGALLLSGCPDREVSAVPIGQEQVERVELPAAEVSDLDLLFVIDNSGSMEDEQTSLKDNFDKFIEILSTIEGGLPNIHIGVVSSDMGTMNGKTFVNCSQLGDGGALHTSPQLPGVTYLEVLRGRAPSFPGTLSSAFQALASVGIEGCDMEAHLMSMKRALEPSRNPGFLRAGAALAVILIADEDDCSLKDGGGGFFDQMDLTRVRSSWSCFRSGTVCDGFRDPSVLGTRPSCRPNETSPFSASVAEMIAFLKGLKPEDQLIVAGIVGTPGPVTVTASSGALDIEKSCSVGGTNGARPATRLDAFVQGFRHSLVTSICKEDLGDPVRQVASLVAGTLGTRCFQAEVAEPHSCSVSVVTAAGTPDEVRTPISECDASHTVKPCWSLAPDPVACATTSTHLALSIDRGGAVPGIGTRVVAECVTR